MYSIAFSSANSPGFIETEPVVFLFEFFQGDVDFVSFDDVSASIGIQLVVGLGDPKDVVLALVVLDFQLERPLEKAGLKVFSWHFFNAWQFHQHL